MTKQKISNESKTQVPCPPNQVTTGPATSTAPLEGPTRPRVSLITIPTRMGLTTTRTTAAVRFRLVWVTTLQRRRNSTIKLPLLYYGLNQSCHFDEGCLKSKSLLFGGWKQGYFF